MLLIADSGSTKTDWVLLDQQIEVARFKTVGLNPYFTTSEMVYRVVDESFPVHVSKEIISYVHFYGSGCSSSNNKSIIEDGLKGLFPLADINIEHDLLAAARALFAHRQGIAGILGTGSNSCVYDGTRVINTIYSLGYMFGDEGSGAYLGKAFITAYLKNRVPKTIHNEFRSTCGLTHDDILTHVYKKPDPNRFLASFTHFLKTHIENDFVNQLVQTAFEDYFREQILVYDNYASMPFAVVGSVGCHFSTQLINAAARFDIKIEKFLMSPVEGLIQFHQINR